MGPFFLFVGLGYGEELVYKNELQVQIIKSDPDGRRYALCNEASMDEHRIMVLLHHENPSCQDGFSWYFTDLNLILVRN